MSLDKARAARAQQSLDKLVRVDGVVMTRRQFMSRLREQGGQLSIRRDRSEAAEDKLRQEISRMDRGWVPIGNPSHPDTVAYLALKQQLRDGVFVDRIVITLPSGVFYVISKAEADYFQACK